MNFSEYDRITLDRQIQNSKLHMFTLESKKRKFDQLEKRAEVLNSYMN